MSRSRFGMHLLLGILEISGRYSRKSEGSTTILSKKKEGSTTMQHSRNSRKISKVDRTDKLGFREEKEARSEVILDMKFEDKNIQTYLYNHQHVCPLVMKENES